MNKVLEKKNPQQMREKLLESLTRPIIKALDSIGINNELLANKLKEELEAKITKQFQYEGKVVESNPKIAWEVRQRARQDAHKLRGDYPSEKHHVTVEGPIDRRPLTEEEQATVEAIKQFRKEQALKKDLGK